jgi:hypothetical protein
VPYFIQPWNRVRSYICYDLHGYANKSSLVLHIVTKVTKYEVSIWVCLVVFSSRFLGNDFTELWIVSRCLF